jgi:hypothetical protein
MNDADVAELIGYFLSAFALGLISGYVLHLFRRAGTYISR